MNEIAHHVDRHVDSEPAVSSGARLREDPFKNLAEIVHAPADFADFDVLRIASPAANPFSSIICASREDDELAAVRIIDPRPRVVVAKRAVCISHDIPLPLLTTNASATFGARYAVTACDIIGASLLRVLGLRRVLRDG